MTSSSALAFQSAFRDFANIDHWLAPHAITLTMRQGDLVHSQMGSTYVPLTPEVASRNYRHFLSLLSSRVLGQAAKRHGRRVNSFSVIEGGEHKRLHIHAVIDCPRSELTEKFPELIKNAWNKTSWGQAEINIQPKANSGCVSYMSKFRDKPNFLDSIDWINCHTIDCRV